MGSLRPWARCSGSRGMGSNGGGHLAVRQKAPVSEGGRYKGLFGGGDAQGFHFAVEVAALKA
jgi:hypothetical protein